MAIEHAKDLLKLRVLDNGEWAMMPCNPHRKKEVQVHIAVVDALGIVGNELSFGRLGQDTMLDVTM